MVEARRRTHERKSLWAFGVSVWEGSPFMASLLSLKLELGMKRSERDPNWSLPLIAWVSKTYIMLITDEWLSSALVRLN